jgi:mannose-6-phosphate isomerase-like protein (cupin superfamily)
MHQLIAKALQDYGKLIASHKPNELSVSTYRVEKPWGFEIWLEINEFYTMKLIHMNKGERSSLQSHEHKYETNFVIEGEAEVLLEDKYGDFVSRTYKEGDGWTVPTGRKHRVTAKTSYTAIEASTTHLDDVIRHKDDAGRPSGKVDSEHQQGN